MATVAAGAFAVAGASLGTWLGVVAHPLNDAISVAAAMKIDGATKRLPVNPTVNSHPRGEAQEDRFDEI